MTKWDKISQGNIFIQKTIEKLFTKEKQCVIMSSCQFVK